MNTKNSIVLLVLVGLVSAGCGKKKKQPAAGAGSAAGSATASADVGTGGALWTSAPDPEQQAVLAAASDASALVGAGKASTAGQLIDAIAAAHALVPRDAWDPAAVVAAVGKDRVALFNWVRDQTALVPYRGSLRGAVGVMMDRVGNSLDRSLLLAELLKQAGLDVRLANAQLDPALVAKLAASTETRARPALPSAKLDDNALAATAGTLLGIDGTALQAAIAKAQAALDARTARTKARVAEQGKALAALVPAPGAQARDTEAFVDHWWVQVNDGEAWSDLDPALPTAAPGESFAPTAGETLAPETLADDRRHTLTVRVIGEVWHDDAREEATLLDHTFAPNQFYGQRIVVQNLPLDMPEDKTIFGAKDPVAAARTALLAQTEFAPVLRVGGTPVAGFSVNDRGELTNLTAGDANTMRLGRAVQHATTDGVGGATDLLGELPGSDTAGSAAPAAPSPAKNRQAFTAEWLEIEVRSPGLPPRIVRRTIFDTIGAGVTDRAAAPRTALAEPARLDRMFALIGETELLPMFAQIPAAFVQDRTVKALVAARDVIVALAAKQDLAPMREKLGTLAPIPGPLYGLALARLSLDSQVYLDRLNVLASRDRIVATAATGTPSVAIRREVDILANGVAVWPTVKDPRAARIAQGVADTAFESVVYGCAKGVTCVRAPSTSDLFAASSGKGWAVVTTPAGAAAADASAGYAIVANGPAAASWWRIDPTTGETLGMNPMGGDAAAEEAALQANLTANFVLGVSALAHCIYATATSSTSTFGDGVRCVGAATLGFFAAQLGILAGGSIVLATLLQGIAQWI
jgi:hypothetical protein